MTTRNEPGPCRIGPLADLTGEQLAVRAGKGGPAAHDAFAELVTRYQARLYNFLLRRVGSRQDAEDVTQDAFVKAWEKIASYDPAWRFSTWLFTIGLRHAITQHRRARPTAGACLPEAAAPLPADTESARARGARLWALAAERLGEEQHTALWLRYAEDMGIQEIGKVMGKSDVAVRVCLFRARQALAAACGQSETALDQPNALTPPAAAVLSGGAR